MTILQILWFFLIFVLIAGYFVLDGFDLGAGVLYPVLAKDETERAYIRRSIGPVWDGNEVWLLTAGGALFAAFPAAYATTFSGFYLAVMRVGRVLHRGIVLAGASARGCRGQCVRGYSHGGERGLLGCPASGAHHPVHAARGASRFLDVPDGGVLVDRA